MNKINALVYYCLTITMLLSACSSPASMDLPSDSAMETEQIIQKSQAPLPPNNPDELIWPEDLEYIGAFRLPDGPPEIGWEWSGSAMTYYPQGDSEGPDDGFPGSIFGTGHEWNQYVSEISIPAPLISSSKDTNELPTATTLQPFTDIRAGLYDYLEIPRVGLSYIPPRDSKASGKLYFAWAQHMGEGETNPSHGWSELDLSNTQPQGLWRIGEYWNFVTGDYIFTIPNEWADAYMGGMFLVTGRFRDGGQGALGPSLFAISPQSEGDPPAPGTTIPALPLLLYDNVYEGIGNTLTGYHHSDEWSGAAWLTKNDQAAVVFIGTKGLGECWYGCADGTVWPDEPPFPPECEERGWWSTTFEGQMLFFSSFDLATVALGDMTPSEPQPYATLNIDDYLFHIESNQQKQHLGAAAFDQENGFLYIFEPLADGEKSIVHVWKVR